MTRLSSCWFLIEQFVIPDGLLKWFYLSFYVHPSLLVPCQLYLWIKVLLSLLLTIVLFVYRISCFLITSPVQRFLKFVILLFKKFLVPNTKPIVIEEEEEFYDIPYTENEIVLHRSSMTSTESQEPVHLDTSSTESQEPVHMDTSSTESQEPVHLDTISTESQEMVHFSELQETVHLNTSSKSHDMIYVYDFQTKVAEMFAESHKISSFRELSKSMEPEKLHGENLIYDESDNIYSNSCFSQMDSSVLSDTELEVEFSPSSSVSSSSPGLNDDYIPSPCSSSSSTLFSYTYATVLMDQQQLVRDTTSAGEEVDLLYKKYAESMSWFDVLNHDRLCAISAIQRKQYLSSPDSFESKIQATGLPVEYISLSKVAQKRLVRSLESELELVYVAQSCLSWEALHHQYRKVEALCTSTTSQNGLFYGNVAARFQKFQILLERFVEDDSCGGKRHTNYVHTRLSQKNLLQVPEVSGYVESNERVNIIGESSKAIEVLKTIEKCIYAFWFYVRTDCKKTTWKAKSYLRVEDPRDIHLLHDLTKKLQMKKLWLRDVQGKRKCWLRRAIKHPQTEYCSKIELLFTLIDMKLVSRVLHMSTISTTHLKWCQQKLRNIQFKDGQILRNPTTLQLFPS